MALFGWQKESIDAAHTTWLRGGTIMLNVDMELVQQLRHHFGPSLTHISAMYHPTRAV